MDLLGAPVSQRYYGFFWGLDTYNFFPASEDGGSGYCCWLGVCRIGLVMNVDPFVMFFVCKM